MQVVQQVDKKKFYFDWCVMSSGWYLFSAVKIYGGHRRESEVLFPN